MTIILDNDTYKATIETLGAELIHLVRKSDGYDYMWSGDSTYWSGRSPVLFPIIGSLNGGQIKVADKSYSMGNHGFARKSEFECVSSSQKEAVFRLSESEETLKQYPFKFTLELKCCLTTSGVQINYSVINDDEIIMPFQIGTHAAFNCPFGTSAELKEWYLEFEKVETLKRLGVKDNLIDVNDQTTVMSHSNILPLKKEDFYEYAFVFKNIESKSVRLKSKVTDESIKVSYDNLPDLAIWQPKDAPFLCIEPWYGHGDVLGFEGDIMEKEPMVHLKPKDIFEACLRIDVDNA